jgi:hypothetical protein
MTKEEFDATVWYLADNNPKYMENIYDIRTITLRDLDKNKEQEEFEDAILEIKTLILYKRI